MNSERRRALYIFLSSQHSGRTVRHGIMRRALHTRLQLRSIMLPGLLTCILAAMHAPVDQKEESRKSLITCSVVQKQRACFSRWVNPWPTRPLSSPDFPQGLETAWDKEDLPVSWEKKRKHSIWFPVPNSRGLWGRKKNK